MKFYTFNEWLWNIFPVHQTLKSLMCKVWCVCVCACVCDHTCSCGPTLMCQSLVFSEIMSRENPKVTHSSFRQSGQIIDSWDVGWKDLAGPMFPCSPLAQSLCGWDEAHRCSADAGAVHRAQAGRTEGQCRVSCPKWVGGGYAHRVLPELGHVV